MKCNDMQHFLTAQNLAMCFVRKKERKKKLILRDDPLEQWMVNMFVHSLHGTYQLGMHPSPSI